MTGDFNVKHIFQLIVSVLVIGCISACQPPRAEPVECVCKCETECTFPGAAAPQTAKSTTRESKTDDARKRRAKAARAQRLKEDKGNCPQKESAKKATAGVVTAEPGSGRSTELTEPQKAAMGKAFTEFLAAAKTRDLKGMKAWATERLSTSLEQSLPRYEDRLFNSLQEKEAPNLADRPAAVYIQPKNLS